MTPSSDTHRLCGSDWAGVGPFLASLGWHWHLASGARFTGEMPVPPDNYLVSPWSFDQLQATKRGAVRFLANSTTARLPSV